MAWERSEDDNGRRKRALGMEWRGEQREDEEAVAGNDNPVVKESPRTVSSKSTSCKDQY